MRAPGSARWCAESGSLCGLCPTEIDSHVTPKFWIELAWLSESDTVFSAETSALRRPSGRPTASNAPRTTRCVCRCTRWSTGLPLATPMVAIEYESAKSFEVKASTTCETYGVSPTSSERPATRWFHGRPCPRRMSHAVHIGRKM